MNTFWELERHGDAIALVQDSGVSLTYRQVAEDADRVAAPLGRARRLVFILCSNDVESVVAYLACLRSGHVPVLLSASLDEEGLASLRACYRPHFLWRVVRGAEVAVYGRYLWEAEDDADETPFCGDLALLLTTSGSTGSPKFVRLSQGNIQSNAAAIASYLGLTASERAVTVLPMNYSYGLSVINSHLLVGAKVLLTSLAVIQGGFWSFVRGEGATSLSGVPYTYDMYLRVGLLKMDLPTLRYLTQAGGRLEPDKVRQIAEWAVQRQRRFFVMYGQTEATARMSYVPPERLPEKSASVGIAIPGGRFSLLAADGCKIESSGVDGELVYEGPNVCLGYAECRADLQKPDENGGVLKTGDLARFDDDRFVHITGRLRHFIKIAGNRIGLSSLDALLRAHGVDAVCGGKDNRLCVAVLREEDVPKAKAFIDNLLHLHGSLYRITVVDRFPLNEFGKVQHHSLFGAVLDD